MVRETNSQGKEEENGGGIFDKYSSTDSGISAPAKPLTKGDLIDYFVSGCKPKDKRRYDYYLFISRLIFIHLF